jgi:predicted transcriptional regulator
MADLNTKEVARELGTDPKTLRRFIRAHVKSQGGTVGEDTPGQGGRYSFDEEDVPKMGELFEEWLAKKAAKVTKVEEAEEEILEDEDAEADDVDEELVSEDDEDLDLEDVG